MELGAWDKVWGGGGGGGSGGGVGVCVCGHCVCVWGGGVRGAALQGIVDRPTMQLCEGRQRHMRAGNVSINKIAIVHHSLFACVSAHTEEDHRIQEWVAA